MPALALALAPTLAGSAAAGAPPHFPNLPEIALPHERAVADEHILPLIEARGSPEPEEALAALDPALAKLEGPSRLRGFVQMIRGQALHQLGEVAAARDAIEEGIRLLPGYSAPLLVGAMIYAYSDQPGRAADLLLRAASLDPGAVRRSSNYDVDNLLRRLEAQRDPRRAGMVSDRLIQIGWQGERIETRSAVARRAIEWRMAEGDPEGARRHIPRLLDPADAQRLLIQNRYRTLWPHIEQWAGPMLEKQWVLYLDEAEAQWRASGDGAAARSYVRALGLARNYDTIIAQMLPRLGPGLISREGVGDFIFLVSPVAEALARRRRWDEAEALWQQGLAIWKPGVHPNALNISANRARLLLYRGMPAESLAAMDAALADAARWGGQIDKAALAAMHHYRACALHLIGRDSEASSSRSIAVASEPPTAVASLHLCLGDREAARDVLLDALRREDRPEDVLLFLQENDEPPMDSAWAREIGRAHQELRTDPRLLAAAAAHGRILPYPLSRGVPEDRRSAR